MAKAPRNVLQRDDVVARLDRRDALADALDDARALVAEHDRKRALRILARQSVGVGVADACVVDLDADFVGLWWCDFDFFDGQVGGRLPGDSGLASNGLKP